MAPASTAAKARGKPVDASMIDLLGKAKDAKLVARLAAQEGGAAVAFLERAFREGSVAVRAAAAEALGDVAPDLGARLAGAALDELLAQKKPPKKELAALLACLEAAGTDDALDRVIALALAPKGPASSHAWERPSPALAARVVQRLPSLDDATWRKALDVFDLPASLAACVEGAEREAARPFVDALLAGAPRQAQVTAQDRHEAARVLFAWRDEAALAVLRAHALPDALAASGESALPDDIALAVLLEGDPAVAFDALAPRFRAGGVVRYRIAELLTPRADPRWRDEARALVPDDPRAAFDALLALGDVDTVIEAARAPVLDAVTKQALHALGQRQEPRGAPLLRAWLTRDEGTAVAPMLLAALAECGGADDAAFLEQRLAAGAAAGATSSHEGFYRHAIARLQARA